MPRRSTNKQKIMGTRGGNVQKQKVRKKGKKGRRR